PPPPPRPVQGARSRSVFFYRGGLVECSTLRKPALQAYSGGKTSFARRGGCRTRPGYLRRRARGPFLSRKQPILGQPTRQTISGQSPQRQRGIPVPSLTLRALTDSYAA